MGQLERKGMAVATVVLMASTLASRLLGLVREGLLAARLGTGLDADAYATAFMLPDLLNTFLTAGFLSVTFLPLYQQARREEGEDAAGSFLSVAVGCLLALGAVGVVILGVWARHFLAWLQPGLVGSPAMERAIELSRVLLPAQLCFLAAGAWNGAQYAHRQFLFPALAPLVYNGGILAGGLWLAPKLGAMGFAWGVLAGAFLGHFLLQAAGCRRIGVPMRPHWDAATRSRLAQFAARTIPLMLGLTLSAWSELLLRRMAGACGPGAVAEANYSFRLMQVLVGLFGQAAGLASYPYLVDLCGQNRWDELRDLLRQSFAKMGTILLPMSAFVAVFSPQIVSAALQRGAFKANATQEVAQLLRLMVWAVFPWCLQILLARTQYARGRFWSTAVVGSLAIVLGWGIWAYWVDQAGKIGIAGGLLALVALQVAALGWNLRDLPGASTIVPWTFWKGVLWATVLGSAGSYLAWLWVRHLEIGPIGKLLLGGVVFAVFFLPLAWWLELPGIREWTGKVGNRFRMSRSNSGEA